jgi:hypothetical protein
MGDLDDFELDKTKGEAEAEASRRARDRDLELPDADAYRAEPDGSRLGVRAGLAAGILLLAGGLLWVFTLVFRHPTAPLVTPPPIANEAPPSSTLPVAAGPSLEGSDPFVRDVAKGLSSHPQLAVWLAAKDLVRTLAAVIDNIASGDSPSPHLAFLAPREPFRVVQKRGRTLIDRKAYARWDSFGQGVAALDAAECARVFRRLEPLFEAAARELGHQEGFAPGFKRASAAILAVPVPEGDVAVVRVVRAKPVYEYADKRLEALTPAQKQLLRMGPANQRRIQAKLREIQTALGAGGDHD